MNELFRYNFTSLNLYKTTNNGFFSTSTHPTLDGSQYTGTITYYYYYYHCCNYLMLFLFDIIHKLGIKILNFFHSKTITNMLLKMTKTSIPNFKLFKKIKIIIEVFYIKSLDSYQDNVRFPIFEHILNLKHCRHRVIKRKGEA